MSQFVSTRIVTDGLLLNLDTSNKKSYKENLLTNSDTISSATWGSAQISVIPYVCQAPDGTMTGIQVTSTGTDPYFNQVVSVEAGVTYTATCYIKSTGSVVGKTSGYIWAWFFGTATGSNTLSNTVTLSNNWQKLSVTFTPTGSGTLLIRVDPDDGLTSPVAAGDTYFIAGLQLNRGSVAAPRVSTAATTFDASLNDSSRAIGTYPAFTPIVSKYLNYDTNGLKITRATGATKDGGRVYYDFTGTPLAVGQFMLNNHTWEVWFRIDDRNPGSTQGWTTYEGSSCLTLYSGNHAGFYYDSTVMYYTYWDSANVYYPCTWSVGASGSAAQIKEGSWNCLTVTRNGNIFTPYLNGVAGTPTTQSNTSTSLTSNVLYIGATQTNAAGAGDFCWYSKYTFGAMKMYNRALSATEVAQNFNALRGRFGI